MLESKFQSIVIRELRALYPGSIVIKLDSAQIQGIPDVLILYNDRWGALETKQTKLSKYRPNQSYYIEKMNTMSFAAKISPENKEKVYAQLALALGFERITRVSKSK